MCLLNNRANFGFGTLARAALELAFGLGVLLDRIALGVGLVVDRLRIDRRRVRFGGLVLRHALLEGLDALRKVAHQRRDLAAAAEQDEHNDGDKQPMHPTKRTHFGPSSRSADTASRGLPEP